jgi:non-ribosomal peptide synthase protein (TIGR01720 family)
VGAAVSGGRLTVTWGYGRRVHRRETVGRVAGWMMEELRALAAHCRDEGGAGRLSPADFPAAGLSQRELDDFLTSLA